MKVLEPGHRYILSEARAQAAEADADRSKQALGVVRTWAENVGGHTPPWYAQVCDVLDVVKLKGGDVG